MLEVPRRQRETHNTFHCASSVYCSTESKWVLLLPSVLRALQSTEHTPVAKDQERTEAVHVELLLVLYGHTL